MKTILFYPPITFFIFLIIGSLIHILSKALRPKSTLGDEKLTTYACGENIPGRKVKHSYHFFRFAFLFTILHIAVLIIATVPKGIVAILGIAYLIIILLTVIVLLTEQPSN